MAAILLRRVDLVKLPAPSGQKCSAHSIRIGTSTAMQLLKIRDSKIIRHLGRKNPDVLLILMNFCRKTPLTAGCSDNICNVMHCCFSYAYRLNIAKPATELRSKSRGPGVPYC